MGKHKLYLVLLLLASLIMVPGNLVWAQEVTDVLADQVALAVSTPSEVNVNEGNSATFSVEASGGASSGYTYQWYYIDPATGGTVQVDGAEMSSYTIEAEDVTADLNGRYYYCTVSDGQDSVDSVWAKLSVYYPPTFATQTQDQNVEEKNSVIFYVNVNKGNPTNYTCQWYYSYTLDGTGYEISGARGTRYTIPSSTVKGSLNGRYYYCVLDNGKYTVESARAKLSVYHAPTITSHPQDQSVKEKNSATFDVSVSGGNPTNYSYQWYEVSLETGGAANLIEDATASSYKIPESDVTASDDGTYYFCIVSNGHYSVTSDMALLSVEQVSSGTADKSNTETQPQPKPVTLSAPTARVYLTSANAVTVSWDSVSGASGYRIYRATSANGSYSELVTLGTVTSYTDTDLKTGKTYYYKVEAFQGNITGSLSDAVAKEIIGKPATPKQKKLKVNAAAKKVTISWNSVKRAEKIEILRSVDGGKFKKWKTVSAKKKKATYSYKKFKKGHKYTIRLRGYYIEDGIKVYSNYSKGVSFKVK